MKEYYQINIEKYREYSHKYYFDNIEKRTIYHHQYSVDNKEKISRMLKIWRKNNSERYKEYSKNYYQENKETRLKYGQEHKKERNEYQRNKRKTDLKTNLNHNISSAIYHSLKDNKAGRHWESLVDYTVNDLIKHLRKTIPENYCWNDFLEGKLQIDHIIPINAFDFDSPEQLNFQRCWTLKNLRLLTKEENLKKSDNLLRPFQLALDITLT